VKILLDEMYSGLKEFFEIMGRHVSTIQEVGLQGAKDRQVVEYAKNHCMLIVTQDQKTADLADLTGVRSVLISSSMIAKMADERMKEKYPE
jgi:predicted nuclease of predicted toxin-antitoxin system